MVRGYDLKNGSVVESAEAAPTVLVYVNPDQSEKDHLVKTYSIDEHTLTSSLDPEEVSRLEFETDHAALIYKRPRNYSSEDEFLFKVSSVGAFLFHDRLILVMLEDVPMFDGKVFQQGKIGSLPELVLKVVYRTIYHFYGHLKVINAISSEIEQKIRSTMDNKHLINMFALEKSLVYYLDAINSNQVVIERLKNNAPKLSMTTDCVEQLDDILIENKQCYTQAEIYSNVLSGLMDARASIVNNNLNVLIKRLTIINIVFMPLNLLAGIGGMSEFSMMTHGIRWPVAYGFFLVSMVIIGFITYAIMMKMGAERDARLSRTRRTWNFITRRRA